MSRNITLFYESSDGFTEEKSFKTLRGARAYAQRRIGTPFDLGSFYAVSADGIGKLEAQGASLEELLLSDEVLAANAAYEKRLAAEAEQHNAIVNARAAIPSWPSEQDVNGYSDLPF